MQEKLEYFKKPRKCPNCSSKKIALILYGYPAFSPKLESDLNEGRIVLGGCVISLDDPSWECADCHVQFYKKIL